MYCGAVPTEPLRKTDVRVRNRAYKSGDGIGALSQSHRIRTPQARLDTSSQIHHQERDTRLEHDLGGFRILVNVGFRYRCRVAGSHGSTHQNDLARLGRQVWILQEG